MAGNNYQPLQLGWGQFCINVADIAASWEFYRRLGFALAGGKLEDHWAVLQNGTTELGLFQGTMQENIINFRGPHIQNLAAELRARGFELDSEMGYDADKYPAEWSHDAAGNQLPSEGSGSFNVFDPTGMCLFFDTVPVERAAFEAGRRFSFEALPMPADGVQQQLGDCTICLSIHDVPVSCAFYERLGMFHVEGNRHHDWSVYNTPGPRDFRIGLFGKQHVGETALNFRGGDVFGIGERLKGEGLGIERGPEKESDGSDGLWLRDPDGNLIYFNTAPQERQY